MYVAEIRFCSASSPSCVAVTFFSKKTCIVGSFVAFKGKKMRMRMRKDDILKQQQTYKVFQFHDKSHYKTNAMKTLKDI